MEETEHWASNQVSACKADYEEKESLLTEKEFKLEGKLRRADDLIEHREEYIESEADKRAAKITKIVKDEYREKTEKYKNDYEIKRQSLYGAFILSICYGVLTTIFRCFQSDRFMYDFGASLLWIWEYISGRFMVIYDAAEGVWLFFASIPYPVIGAICGGLLVIIVVIIHLLIFYVVPIGGIGLLTYLYVSRIGDLLSASVALGSFAIIVWFADNMTAITLNLILVWLLVQGVYVVTRSICVYFRMYH